MEKNKSTIRWYVIPFYCTFPWFLSFLLSPLLFTSFSLFCLCFLLDFQINPHPCQLTVFIKLFFFLLYFVDSVLTLVITFEPALDNFRTVHLFHFGFLFIAISQIHFAVISIFSQSSFHRLCRCLSIVNAAILLLLMHTCFCYNIQISVYCKKYPANPKPTVIFRIHFCCSILSDISCCSFFWIVGIFV